LYRLAVAPATGLVGNRAPSIFSRVYSWPRVRGLVVRDAWRCHAPHHEGL